MGYDEEDTFLLPLNVTISLSPVGVENIGIDEFAVRKGHIKTIGVDPDNGRMPYIGKGFEIQFLLKEKIIS